MWNVFNVTITTISNKCFFYFIALHLHITSDFLPQDGEDVEEWERGEAFRDTIDEEKSAKERRYEEEIEV